MKEKRIYPHRPYKAVANLSNTTEEQKQNVIELYTSGLSQTQIEKDLKMTRKTIRTILKEVDQDRTKSQQWRLRYGSTLNENAFETLTPESEYWIGFLYADGHILGHRGYAVEVGVHTHDKEHLDKFLTFLESNNSIIKDPRGEYYRVRIGSEKLHNSLMALGFTHNKSVDAVPFESLINSRDFWRGVVDGDGCLHMVLANDYPMLALCGTKSTIKEFLEFARRNGIQTKAVGSIAAKGRALWQVSLACNNAIQTAHLLYKDATVYLDRKYAIYQESFCNL